MALILFTDSSKPKVINAGARQGFIMRTKGKGRYAQPNGESGKGANKGKPAKLRMPCPFCPYQFGEPAYVWVSPNARKASCKAKHTWLANVGCIPGNASYVL
jgi:hypothetical protein